MSREPYVLGVGMTTFGKHPDATLGELGAEAVRAAVHDIGGPVVIDEVFAGSALGGMLVGQRVMRDVGANGLPIFNVENACSSSAAALHLALDRVRSGVCGTALVVGVEQLTKLGGGPLPLDADDWEAAQGMVMPAVYAMRARRYMTETGTTAEDLAEVSVKNHNNGVLNPRAAWNKTIDLDDVAASRMIADPFTLLHCCPSVDGAAAVLISTKERAEARDGDKVRVLSSVVRSGEFKNGFRDMTRSALSFRAIEQAYTEAGITARDVDVAEVHDAFTIAELMYYESLGLCGHGEAVELLRSGATQITGSTPVNPSGGLLARGHPVGATGAAQIVELVYQLRGDAGAVQVTNDPEIAVAHCTGGGAWGFDHGVCSIHLLARC